MLALYYQDPEFAALPRTQRERVSILAGTIAGHQPGEAITKPGGLIQRIMQAAACSKGLALKMYYAYRKNGDWRELCDKRSLAPVRTTNEGTKSPRFREWVRTQMERNQRSTQQAIILIQDTIKYGYEVIPGLEDWPLASGRLPAGCSETSLRAMVKKHALAPVRYGLKSAEARAHDPMVLRTRVGVPVGSVYELDDVWHDNYIVSANQAARVLEFGCIDYASAARIHWGNTPHVVKEDGKRQGLTQEMFVLFVAYLLRYVGFAKSGVDLHMERGTATLPENVIKLITTSGMGINIVRGRATGSTQKKLGGYSGQIGGNPRAKALIENSHNLLHNFYGNIPGQTGKDRQHTQESTLGRIKEQEQLEKWRGKMLELGRNDLATALQNHLFTSHQFNEWLIVGYNLINNRQEHDLEGWAPYTEVAIELAPNIWRPLSELSMTPLLREQINSGDIATKEVRLSPWQVWQTRKPEWATIPMSLYLDILASTKLCARKITVRAEMLTVQDKLIGQDKLYYDFNIITPNGTQQRLEEGRSYDCIFNPYAPNSLLITDARGTVIGEAPQLTRVRANAYDELQGSQQRVQRRKSDMLARASIRHEEQNAARATKSAHNRELAIQAGLAKPLQKPRLATPPRAKKEKLKSPNHRETELDDIFATPLPSRTKRQLDL